jgi:hypothetical protein
MAVTATAYQNFPVNLLTSKISDLSSATSDIRVMLLANTYIADMAAHEKIGDVSANEITGIGYTAGGAALTNKVVNLVGGKAVLDADDTSWSASTFIARYAVIYDNTPVTTTDKKLIALVDLGDVKSPENGTFRLEWDASGIIQLG